MSFIVLIYGLLIGSFLNVCIYRIPNGQSIVFPPSHCGACNTKLKWKDLIPVISYLRLKGRCRYCGEKVSIIYPLIEIITAIAFVMVYFKYGWTFNFLKFCILICILIVISVIDIKTQDVYFVTTATGMAIGIGCSVMEYMVFHTSMINYLLGMLIGAATIGAIVFITGAMGEGDIEIAALSGIFLGWKLTILMILLSFILGAVISLLLIVTKKRKRDDFIAFGPFISLATFVALIYGEKIISLYSKLF